MFNENEIKATFLNNEESDKKYALIQFFGVTPTGQPIILSKVYEGTEEIDFDNIKKLTKEKESKIILLGNQNKTNQLEIIDEILQNTYHYKHLKINYNFNFQ